ATADRAIVDQQPQVAIGGAQQGRHRVAAATDVGIAIERTEAGLHRFEGGEQLLELELAAGHAETQRLQAQHAVIEHEVRGQVLEGQFFAVHDALAAEAHVGVHGAPAL
uniref:DUF4157 domain-containing protein n=1 Tax=Steinernema glaseri TaxID=37863 RepID=A0A1I8ADQ7_9BILA